MTITLRRTKQAPLTIDELDDNFSELDSRLEKLEKLLKQQENITEITQDGNILKFKTLTGMEIGRAVFPPCFLNYKGVFNQKTSYDKGELVIYKNKAYQALHLTTPETPFKPEEWKLALELDSFHEKESNNKVLSGGIPKYLETELPKPVPGDLVISITNSGAKLLIGQEKEWLCLSLNKNKVL